MRVVRSPIAAYIISGTKQFITKSDEIIIIFAVVSIIAKREKKGWFFELDFQEFYRTIKGQKPHGFDSQPTNQLGPAILTK
jgi:hypothetical protein